MKWLLMAVLLIVVAAMYRAGRTSLRWLFEDAETDAFIAEIRRVKKPSDREPGLVLVSHIDQAGQLQTAPEWVRDDSMWHTLKRAQLDGAP